MSTHIEIPPGFVRFSHKTDLPANFDPATCYSWQGPVLAGYWKSFLRGFETKCLIAPDPKIDYEPENYELIIPTRTPEGCNPQVYVCCDNEHVTGMYSWLDFDKLTEHGVSISHTFPMRVRKDIEDEI